MRCAAQPAIREQAKSGVMRSAGMPIMEYTKPEYMSTFAHMSLFVPFSCKMTSGARRSIDFSRLSSGSYSVPSARRVAKSLQMMARGSESV